MNFEFNKSLLNLKNYDYTEISDDNNKIYLDLNENSYIQQLDTTTSILYDQLKYLYLYPRSKKINDKLLNNLSEYCGINKENIYVTSGSDNALKYIFHTFCQKNTRTLILTPTYEMIYNFIQLTETEIINLDLCLNNKIPEMNEIINILRNGLLKYRPSIVYFCNPNNPLSYLIPNNEIKLLLQEFNNTIFVVDEAYIEFLDDYKNKSAINLINSYNNLIITRTFSKAFGLASLRIGYMVSNKDFINIIKKQGNNKDVLDISKLAVISILENLSYFNEQFNKLLILNNEICDNINNILNTYPNGDIKECIGKINGGWISIICNEPNKFIEFMNKNYNIVTRNKSHNNIGIVRISMGKKEIMKNIVLACENYQKLTSKITDS